MSNWFTPEQQTQLEALNSQIWADEVASRIKKLWIEDNFKAKAAATTQVTTPTQIEANKQVSDLKVPEVTTSVQETPSETTPVIKKDTVVATEVKAPVQSPKDVKTTPKVQIKEDEVRRALQLTASKGLSSTESISQIKEAFTKRWDDVSTFDTDFANTISEFEQFDTSSDDFFWGLTSGQTYPSFVKNSANYKAGESIFNAYQAQDKTEQWIYLGLKGNSINPSVLNKMKNDPVLSELITKGNNKLVTEKVRNWEIDSLYDLPVGQQTIALEAMMEDLGLNKDVSKIIEDDNTLSTNSKAYTDSVGELNKKYKERQNIRKSLERKYPNASASFINALHTRESGALSDEISELEAQASTYKTTYDFRFWEIKTQIDLESEQLTAKTEIFRDIQRNNYSTFLEELKQADKATASEFQFLSPAKWVIATVNKTTWAVEFTYTKNVWTTTTASGLTTAETVRTAWNVLIGGMGTDLRESNYVSKFPNNASFKNNNPAGLTHWISSKLQAKLEAAGINLEEWTSRPTNEGGSYIGFETLDDGLSAMKIAFYDTGWTDVRSRLEAWKWAWTDAEKKAYVDKIMNDTFGSTDNRDFSSLSSIEKEQLLVNHLKREDGALFGVLSNEMWAIREDGTLDYSKLRTESSADTERQAAIDAIGIATEIYWSKVSDKETENVQNIVKLMPWADRDQIISAVRGFKFNTPEGQEYGTTLLKTARVSLNLPDIDLAGISSLIRSGNKDMALNKMEISVDGAIRTLEKEDYVSESNTRQVYSKVNELNTLIEKLEKADWSPLGNYEGTLDKWLGRFKDTESAEISAKATFLVSKMRKDLIGANITSTETATLDWIIPEINDSVSNFLIKTESLKSDTITNLNSQRERYGLPALNEKNLLDIKERVKIYEWVGIEEENKDEVLLDKEVVNKSLIWPKQTPLEDVFGFWVASLTSAITAPLEIWALLSNAYLSEDIPKSIENDLRIINWEDISVTPLELFDFLDEKVSVKSLVNTLYWISWFGTNEGDLGKTLGQALTWADASITKAVYDELGINAEAQSTKVGEILSADLLYWGWLLVKPLVKGIPRLASKKLVWWVNSKIDKQIEKNFIKGIKPASIGDNAVAQAKYLEKTRTAISTITTNKQGLQFTDELWDIVKGKLPTNVNQFSQSVSQVKSSIYKEYHSIAEKAGTKVNVDFNPIIKELESFKWARTTRDLPESKELNTYIDSIIKGLKEEKWVRGVLDAETLKSAYNKRLQNFYKNPSTGTEKAWVDALINNLIGKQLDWAIESVSWAQYTILKSEYGALSTIEKDVARAAMREAKKANASLIDHSAILSWRDLLTAGATWSMLPVAKAWLTEGFAAYFKHINSPDIAIKNMFKTSEKALFSK